MEGGREGRKKREGGGREGTKERRQAQEFWLKQGRLTPKKAWRFLGDSTKETLDLPCNAATEDWLCRKHSGFFLPPNFSHGDSKRKICWFVFWLSPHKSKPHLCRFLSFTGGSLQFHELEVNTSCPNTSVLLEILWPVQNVKH